MLTLWILCALTLGWMVVYRYKRRRLYELADLVPGSKDEMPFIGLAGDLIGDGEKIMQSLQKFSYEAMNQNGWLKGWLGHILYFICINPGDLEVLLKTCLDKDDLHRFLRNVVGYGGIFAPVSIWRRRRKILVPAFSPKILENFVSVFSEQSEKLVSRLRSCDRKGPFEAWPYLSTYTLDSVCETAMGVKINAQSNPKSPFLNQMNTMLHLVCERIFHLWLQPDWLYNMFPQHKEHDNAIKMMHEFTNDVIKKKREELSRNGEELETGADFNLDLYKKKTFLDLLISISSKDNGYTDEELREEVLTLTIAGTDTSAVAVGYTLQLLAKYPKIQEKVYQELYEVFGDSERPLEKDDLLQLPYLERVVKESLRLFPPVPFIIRKVPNEIKLPSGTTLPAGSGVVISIWGLHRDSKFWGPDAETFDPDRFLPERSQHLADTCSYIPFSSGPRNCLGYQYALMSIKTVLSAILRRFKVVGEEESQVSPNIRVKLAIMMKAVDGYQVALELR